MLFLDIDHDVTSVSEISSMDSTPTLTGTGESSASLSSMVSRPSFSARDVIADTVDQFLWNQDGKIPRQRNEQLYASVFTAHKIFSLMLVVLLRSSRSTSRSRSSTAIEWDRDRDLCYSIFTDFCWATASR